MKKLYVYLALNRNIKMTTVIFFLLLGQTVYAQFGDGKNNAINIGTVSSNDFHYNIGVNTYYNSNTYGLDGKDVWMMFTVTSATQVDMSHCGSGGPTNIYLLNQSETVINSYSRYGPLPCSSANYEASLSEYLQPGVYYLVSETDHSNTTWGNLSITISTPPAGN